MEERTVRLRTHRKNIDRYQRLLRTRLSDDEKHYLEKRLSEERFAVETLQFMSCRAGSDVPGAKQRSGSSLAQRAGGPLRPSDIP